MNERPSHTDVLNTIIVAALTLTYAKNVSPLSYKGNRVFDKELTTSLFNATSTANKRIKTFFEHCSTEEKEKFETFQGLLLEGFQEVIVKELEFLKENVSVEVVKS